jgi:DNA-damage-inducible protein J
MSERENSLAVEPLVPNGETIEAMREARRGGLPRLKTAERLMKDLNVGD